MVSLADNPLLELGPAFGQCAPVLIHHLHGGMDAGHAGSLVTEQLLSSLPARRVATFVSDELIDFRSRRPIMTFEDWSFTDVEVEEIALDLLHTDSGQPLLLLHGPEPDFRWEAFTAAIVELVEIHGVERTIGVSGIPAAVPHTRPSMVNAHSVRPELIPPQAVMLGSVRVPGSAGLFLEARLAGAGHPAVGYVASVPYYLAESEFSQASVALLEQIGAQTGLVLPVGDLQAAATVEAQRIAEQISQAPEVEQIIRKLEGQSERQAGGGPEAAPAPQIPSAEEIGLQLQQFLANESLRREADGFASFNLPVSRPAAQITPPQRGRHRGQAPWDDVAEDLGNN